jgi:poly(3-hydroxybutyrate) depolymerase
MTREFLEYVPHDVSPHSPLVIVLHGALMDAKLMREWTGYEFDQLADQHGFVVVYPDGYKHAWNDCHSEATFAAHIENTDDMGFVKDLIAREVAQRQIDEKHVYVLGYSNGGQMALRLALQAPEQVAGIAIAGPVYRLQKIPHARSRDPCPCWSFRERKTPSIRLLEAESHSLGSATEAECSPRSIPRRRLRSDSV